MKFKTLLFDVDDTLLDFKLTEKKALHALFQEEEIPLTEEIETTYKKINHRLWREFEQGKTDKKTVIDTRFSLLFEQYGKKVDGKQMGEKYRYHLSQGHDLLGNSKEIISRLRPDYELYIVTNGVAKTQYQRLKDSQMTPFFDDIFVSEEVGYQKPMKEYFDYVFDRIPNFDREKTMIIGDSLASDIQGGNKADIQTLWLNPENQATDGVIQPTYEISKLDDIFTILAD
ncbi:YjjG family noncanonical pyrimidine nucleotidase [Enterococcus sp. DIV0242_7C1]|uniref:TIGR02254 family HAD hydrolase n=1 Tax=Candidatus Enterococcus dunnyi TaxID=1834192 RepID=A0A200J859_9ENTE|nr:MULTISPECIES: YjjG family noncanonical pyrimidine nucleotidase [unclassified Enterococcus]MBO0470565.1 YjjG family noncanonical pyrimidine nucleotidase [Enterococcus sp. DIV0242_7C1]OUZ33009.1 TIGR02254 family HAD hydrolase [Enterococcus sp. 9D6_DIV0238]